MTHCDDHHYDCHYNDDIGEDWNRLEGGDGKEPVEGDEGKAGPGFDQTHNYLIRHNNYLIRHTIILVESRSWRDRNLKFGPNCDLEVDNLEKNKKFGARRKIWILEEKFGINCSSAEAQFGTGRGIRKKIKNLARLRLDKFFIFFQIIHLQITIWAKF